MNNKEKLIQDNYSKINQISARCMRVIVAILALAFVYCYFGPDMDDIHTPKESMNVESVRRTWKYVLEILRRLK